MWWKGLFVRLSLTVLLFSSSWAIAACPSADLSGDCFVDYEDFALMGVQWLNGYDLNDLTEMANQWLTGYPNMAYIPDGGFEMGDHHGDGYFDELPLHTVLIGAFFMSKFEITNQQYCDYLNDANSLNLIEVRSGVVYASPGGTDPYCNTRYADGDSQIDHNDESGLFSVMFKNSRNMSDDPMVEVSWYGAVAYCNWRSSKEGYESCYNLSTWNYDFSKQSYRLATEAEWEYAARGGEHSPYYQFPWGDMINHDYANYKANGAVFDYDTSPYTTYTFDPNWNDGTYPYTSIVGSFAANPYGLYDMTGNVWEWCNDWYDEYYYSTTPYPHVNPQGPAIGWDRILRGNGWYGSAYSSRVATRGSSSPGGRSGSFGFRIVLDLMAIDSTKIGHWQMDDNAANTTVTDSSSKGNHGTAQQNTSVLHTAGIIDGALAFNGTSDYIDCGEISTGENISISVWIKTDDSSFEIIAGNVGGSEAAGVRLTKYDNGQSGILISDGISDLECMADSNIADGSWHFIVATVDTAVAKIYVDGEYKNEVDISGQGSHVSIDTFYIGKRPGGSPSYFTGPIDDVRIYGQALTPAEITLLYNLVP